MWMKVVNKIKSYYGQGGETHTDTDVRTYVCTQENGTEQKRDVKNKSIRHEAPEAAIAAFLQIS